MKKIKIKISGRPGWHIECTVMSQKILKTDTLDIHAGGRDLIFPHHENEIAQGQALTARPFAKYWIHHGLLTINGQKMAKSAGNFVTIKDFIEKYKDADILKLFFLSTHYSHPIDYNEEKMKEAKKQKDSFDIFFEKVDNWGILGKKMTGEYSDSDKNQIDSICSTFQKAMDDDFNTPQALACLFELMDLGSRFVSLDKEKAFRYVKTKLTEFFGIFGLKVKPKERLDPKAIKLIKERDLAKKNKDFKKADAMRDELGLTYNILVSDTSNNVSITRTRL